METHLLRGTWRADRHGPRPALVANTEADPFAEFEPESPQTAAQPRRDAEQPASPPQALLAGLRPAGAAFVTATYAEFDGWSAAKRLVLRRCGQLVDMEAALTGKASKRREWLAVHRALLASLHALHLED